MGAPEGDLREEYALLYDMLHRLIDENEKELTSSVEPEVIVATKSKRKDRVKHHDIAIGGNTTPTYNLRPRNDVGKVITDK